MNTEKMREEFEAAYMKDVSERFRAAEVSDEEWIERGSSGEYRSFRAAGAWWAWQASRAAIEVELPYRVGCGDCGEIPSDYGEYIGYEDVKEEIESLGLKVKP